EGDYQRADESDLILEGYIAFLDPPKETTAPALKALKASGITVIKTARYVIMKLSENYPYKGVYEKCLV
ncbi:hypothetical protein INQ71_25695, partial [Escherichia coli]